MKLYKQGYSTLVFFVSVFSGSLVHAEPVTPAATPTPMRWVVNMPNAQAADMVQKAQTALGVPVNMVRQLLQPDSYLIEMQSLPVLGNLQNPQAIAAALKAMPGVRFASPDIPLKSTAVPAPSDPVYAPNQASYMHTGAYASLRMQDVWEQTRGSAAVVIAVLDSGVLFEHRELKGRLLPGYDFVTRVTPTTGTLEAGTVFDSGSNDGDGRDPDPSDPGDAPPPGFTCSDGSTDSSWHGTSVASVAAAQSNNGQFLAGMDWNAKVLPVRVSGRCGVATSSDIVDAFYWATGSGNVDPTIGVNPNPANVINLSFAADTPLLGGGCTASDTVAQAIADARAAGVTVVVSAGNNSGGAIQYPANCPGTIAAGAAEQDGQLATYTAKGASNSYLTLHAPGNASGFYAGASNSGATTPAANGDTALLLAGTSFSAPMVAGAVSLLKAARPALTPSEIDGLLRDNALAYPPNADFTVNAGIVTRRDCTGTNCGAGLLNPLATLAAVRTLATPLPVGNVPQSAVVGSDGPFSLDASLSSNSAGAAENLTFSWQQVYGNPVVLAGTTGSTLQVQSGMTSNIAEFALTVTDTSTNRSNISVIRLANSSVNERTFTPSGTGGGSTTGSPTTEPVVVSQGGGGGGALNLLGLLGLWFGFFVWRAVSTQVDAC
ncbi:S8 family serine peptidase [Limnobacter sp.]|uniref:S8 family serine peptidase n=1 Tax=Limnobacter sp. TaxID=2003368 RepID=UPI002733433D|nr:S8 family serine peptidase [Limnobacter sp.]MDP3189164.1 S8 family serine peptidase [Limnobacter sp.]